MNRKLARSLAGLRDQINVAVPNRSKKMDNTIDNATGMILAMDITHDPENGVDCDKLAVDLIQELDHRGVQGHVIWNRRIRSTHISPGVWRNYTGASPHDHHLHVSMIEDYDSTRTWLLPSLGTVALKVVDPGKIAVDGHLGPATRHRVAFLLGLNSYALQSWWKAAQTWAGLTGKSVDGIEGPQTWDAVRRKLGSNAGRVDDIIKAWQRWCNAQLAVAPNSKARRGVP